MRNLKIKTHGIELLRKAIMNELWALGYRDSGDEDPGPTVKDKDIWFLYPQSDGVIWCDKKGDGVTFREDPSKEVLISDLLDYVRWDKDLKERSIQAKTVTISTSEIKKAFRISDEQILRVSE